MEQAQETVFLCGAFHQGHHQLLMISCNISGLEVRCNFKLCRRNFIVVCFRRDAQPVQLVFKVLHEDLHACRDGTEVMIIKLLAFCRCRTKQGASGQQQVRTTIGKA